MATGIVTCPIDRQSYYRSVRCPKCPDNLYPCQHRPDKTPTTESDEDRANKKKIRQFLGLCLQCERVIPGSKKVEPFDASRCGEIRPDEKCPFVGVRCRDVRLGDIACRNLQPDPSFVDYLVKRKATHKYMISGKLNHRKLNQELRKLNIPDPPSPVRQDTSLERWRFVSQYLELIQPRGDRRFCSDNCRKAYHLQNSL